MILLWMSIAGSIPLIVFLITWFIQKSSFNYSLGKSLLFMSMVFYLIPVQLLTRLLPNKLYYSTVIEKIRSMNSLDFHFEYGNSTYVAIDEGILWIPNIVLYILAIWFVIVLFFAVYEVIKYRKTVRYLLEDSVEKKYYINGTGNTNILVSSNTNIRTPYTIGFIHSKIIFPELILESEHCEYIYNHERAHERNHDALVKLICLMIICLHWFNPLTFLLLYSYSYLCEYISDDYATRGFTFEERKVYANLLLAVAESNVMPIVWRSNFFSTRFLIQRRITYIMKKRFSKLQKMMTVVVSAVALAVSAVTVFAYEPLQSSTEDVITGLSDGDSMGFSFEDNAGMIDDIDMKGHDGLFVTEDGESIVPDNNSSYAICNHSFKSGTYYKHINDGNGGCTVKLYNAEICTKCNYIKLGSLKSTHIYTVCPHNN